MSGKASHAATLELRKQLLIAESELNRAQLFQDYRIMAERVRRVAQQTDGVLMWMSVSALLGAGLSLLRHKKVVPVEDEEKPLRFRSALKAARLASSILLGLHRESRRKQE